jgi:hypothetical protein
MAQSANMSKTELIELILEDLVNQLKSQNDLVSLTLVGSEYKHAEPRRYDELDLVVILRKVTAENKQKIEDIFLRVAKEHTSPTLDVSLENKIGPIKNETTKNSIVMLHLLLFDIRLYRKYCLINHLTPSSWQLRKSLLGKNLLEIHPLRSVTTQDVLHSRSGIYHYIDLVKRGKIIALSLEKKKTSFEYLPKNIELSNEGQMQLMLHTIIKSAGNVLRLQEEVDLANEKEIVSKFKEKFSGFALSQTPETALIEKTRIRTSKVYFDQKDVQAKKREVLHFLEELAGLVEKL